MPPTREALSYACQPHTTLCPRRLRIEAAPIVLHRPSHLIAQELQNQVGTTRLGMFGDVVDCFLQDTK